MRQLLLPILVLWPLACASSAPRKDAPPPTGNAALLPRCITLYDTIRPGLEKQWEATLPMDLFQKARDKVPELKKAYVQECTISMTAEDLACGEGDNTHALEQCTSLAPEFQQPCRDDAEQMRHNPLMCKAVSEVLDRVGRTWMKAQGLSE